MIGRRSPKNWIAAGVSMMLLAGIGAHASMAGWRAETPEPVASSVRTPETEVAAIKGVTGTMPLPDLPVPDMAATPMTAIAQPFHLRGSVIDQSRALTCLATAIYYEAAAEPENGQRAVAQVVLNRVRHPAFPSTVCGVVYQGAERQGCQFSFACDGAMARAPARKWWDRAQRIAASALNGDVYAPVGLATHYHTYQVTPAWNRSLVMTDVEGVHFFHRWKGWWGTPAAFTDRYVGGEPEPRPITFAAVTAEKAAAQRPMLIPAATTPTASPQPVAPTPAVMTAPVTDDSQILDKWKDSGKPLR